MSKNKSLVRRLVCFALCLALTLCCSSAFAAAYQPQVKSDSLYVIENEKFGISNDNTHHVETTNGINDAITWAKENGYSGVRLTDGTYSIFNGYAGDKYKWSRGIYLPSDFTFDLGNATIRLMPNSYQVYYMINVENVKNVTITGGKLIGERYDHDYLTEPGTHEWGIGIYIRFSENVTVSDMEISDVTGYGIGAYGIDLKLINNKIHDCRTIGICYGGDVGGEIAGNNIYNIGYDGDGHGPRPYCGMDIEIEDGNPVGAYGLKIHDNTVSDCYGPGIKCNQYSFHYEVYNNVLNDCSILVGSLATNIYLHDNRITNEFLWIDSSSEGNTHENNTVTGVTTGKTSSEAGQVCMVVDRQTYIPQPSAYVLFITDEQGYLTHGDPEIIETMVKRPEKDHVTGVTRQEIGAAFPTAPEVTAEEGYRFIGWYDEEGNRVESFPAVISESAVYTARFAEKTETDEWENPFTDVRSGDWFYPYVEYVQENKLMLGTSDTTFEPDAATDRGMTVTILYRLEGEPSVAGLSNFPDVPNGEWYANAVAWAKDRKISYGDEFGNFGAEDYLTREQLAAFLYRYAQLKGKAAESKIWLDFADIGEISDWAEEPIKWCVENGIISGKENNILDPQGKATRAEMATMMSRFLEKLK